MSSLAGSKMMMPPYTSRAQNKGKAESFQPSSPLRLQLVLYIVNSDNDWDLVKSSDKKVQRKGYKYASESQAGDQGQFYEKIILESKKWWWGYMRMCKASKWQAKNPVLLSWIGAMESIATAIWHRNFGDLNLPLSSPSYKLFVMEAVLSTQLFTW